MAIIAGARQFATQSGADFTLGAVDTGGLSVQSALENVYGSGNSNAKVSTFRIEDAADASNWEICSATYYTSGTKITNNTTIASSTGSAVTFTGSVVVFGVATENDAKKPLCAVSAYLTSDVTLVANTEKTLTGWTEEWDLGGDFNASTGVFTAPFDGKYRISRKAFFQVGADGDRVRSFIYQDTGGGAAVVCQDNEQAGGTAFLSVSSAPRIFDASATDTFDYRAINVDSADIVQSGAEYTFIQIEYLGDW